MLKKKYLIGIVTSLLLIFTCVVLYNQIGSNKISYNSELPFGGYGTWTDGNYSINQLSNKSDLIVEGKVIKSTPKMSDIIVLTYHDIKIQKCFKGNKKANDIIQIVQTGGILNNKITQQLYDDPLLEQDSNCFLFLKNTKDGYAVLGGFEGIVRMQGNNTNIIVPQDKIGQTFKDKNEIEVSKIIENTLAKQN